MTHTVCPEFYCESTERNNGPKEKDPHQHSSSRSLVLLSAHCLLLHAHLISVLVQGGITDFIGGGQTESGQALGIQYLEYRPGHFCQAMVLRHLATAQRVRVEILFLWNKSSLWIHILIPGGHAQKYRSKKKTGSQTCY